MGATEKFLTVEAALAASSSMLTIREIAAATGKTDDDVTDHVKAMAVLDMIEVMPARGKDGARYGLKSSPKTKSQELNEQALLGVIYDIRKAIGDDTGKIMLGDLADHIRSGIYALKAEFAKETQAREALQEQLDESVEISDVASGFVMLASKRKPRRITKIETARDAAVSAIRAGAQRAEVFALIPIGKAVRGAEWKESP